VRSFYKLGLRILVKVALHQANYFSFEIREYEETVIDVIICQVSHDILNRTPETAFVQCCRQWVEISGLSISSGVTWCPKVEKEKYHGLRRLYFKKLYLSI